MIELAPLEVPLPWIGAEHETVEALQVAVPIDRRAGGVSRQRGDLLLDPLAPVLGVGVRREPFRDPTAGLRLAHAREHLEHVGHLAGIVGGAPHVPQAEVVGLALVVAGELEKRHSQPRARDARVAPELGARDRPDGEPDLRELLLAHLAGGMPRSDVSDLVAHHAGELGLRVQVRQDAAGHVDEAARKCERVHHGVVHDAERPRQIGPLGRRGQPRAELFDPALHPRVGVEAHRGRDVPVVFAPQGDFPRFADEAELPAPGGGVDRAARRGGTQEEREASGADHAR